MKAIVVGLILLLPATAIAQDKDKKEKECAPVPAEFLSDGEVFRDCAVDKPARVSRQPRIDFQSLTPRGSTACMMAVVDLVVDEAGTVLPGSARLVETNDRAYAEQLLAVIHTTRFQPAKKGDVAVKQLYRYKGEVSYRLSSSADPTSRMRRPPPC